MKQRIQLFILAGVILFFLLKVSEMKIQKMELPPEFLSPYVLYTGKLYTGNWEQINQPNCFALNGKSGYGFATIDEELKISYKPVKKGFPPEFTEFRAAGDGKILWGKSGYRGFYAIDTETKKTIEVNSVTNDGSSVIKNGWAPYQDKPWLFLRAPFPRMNRDLTSTTFSCYDLTTGNRVFQREDFKSPRGPESQEYLFLIPSGNNGEFYASKEYRLPDITKTDWELFKVDENGFSLPSHNKLTQIMSEKNFGLTLWSQEIKRWDFNTRYIFGKTLLPKGTPSSFALGIIPSVVRWDEDMEDISVSPLSAHIPKGYYIFGAWAVSPNGEWARCGVNLGREYKTYYNCFFHLSDAYPLGVSPPIVSAASQKVQGIFVEHNELGTLYLDRPKEGTSEDKGNAIFVYKMGEFFDALKAKITQK